MPYKRDGSDVPDSIRQRSSVKRRQWAAVWNSAYERCEAEDGDDCEGAAFAQANAAIQQEVAEAAKLHDYTYNGVKTRASRRRSSTRDDKKYMRDVASGDGTRVVHYGDPELPMQRDNPERRQNFLARHNCDAKRDPLAPGFWACYDWKNTTEEAGMDEEKRITDEGMSYDKSQMEAGGLRVAIDHLRAALEALEGQIMPKPEAAMPEPEPMEAEPETDDLLLTEAAPLEIAEAEAPTNRRAPLDMNVGLIRVGPGNARDNHYYTAEMLERDGGVFQGVKMYATDHRNDEKSVRTEVSQVREVAGLREIEGERYLVGRVTVFNPDFAEDVRNRADAGVLDSLHCSILARGEAQPAEVDGQEYNVVQRITEARSVDWVTRAGAGGRALELAESEPEPEAPEPTEVEESSAQAVLISEDAAQEVIESLAVGEVLAELGTTNLPAVSVSALALAEYHDLSEVRSAVATEVARLKAAGSGQPLGTAKPPEPRPVSRAAVQKLLAEVNQKWLGG